jgi:hypothetical protein
VVLPSFSTWSATGLILFPDEGKPMCIREHA